jgi:hypothetical protein
VLQSRYLRSCDINDIESGPLHTYSITPAPEDGARRRSWRRALRQTSSTSVAVQDSGVQLRVTVKTNSIRVASEVRTVGDGVNSGLLAADLAASLGSPVTNVTLTAKPATLPFDKLPDPNATSGGSLPTWAIGVICGCVLVFLPVPCYVLYRRQKRKHLEALEKQQAEAAAARQRMQSRVIKPGGKSFTIRGSSNPADAHDILVRSGSLGGGMLPYGSGMARVPSGLDLGPGGPGSVAPHSLLGGASPFAPNRPPSFSQQQRAAYQNRSDGFGPPSSRAPSTTGRPQPGAGAVHPMHYADEASTSSDSAGRSN